MILKLLEDESLVIKVAADYEQEPLDMTEFPTHLKSFSGPMCHLHIRRDAIDEYRHLIINKVKAMQPPDGPAAAEGR